MNAYRPLLTLTLAACGATLPAPAAVPTAASTHSAPPVEVIVSNGHVDVVHQGTIEMADVLATDSVNHDEYTFDTSAGMEVVIEMTTDSFDAFLSLHGPGGELLVENDDGEHGDTNSTIRMVAPTTGTYTLIARPFSEGETGPYTVAILCAESLAAELALCSDSCVTANDGQCDDGGAGSLYDLCAMGTDCGDCGERERLVVPSAEPAMTAASL